MTTLQHPHRDALVADLRRKSTRNYLLIVGLTSDDARTTQADVNDGVTRSDWTRIDALSRWPCPGWERSTASARGATRAPPAPATSASR
jgi:hypothetical protein